MKFQLVPKTNANLQQTHTFMYRAELLNLSVVSEIPIIKRGYGSPNCGIVSNAYWIFYNNVGFFMALVKVQCIRES